jgi:hypothetical protein
MNYCGELLVNKGEIIYCHTAMRVNRPWQYKKPLFIAILPYCQAPYKDICMSVAVRDAIR